MTIQSLFGWRSVLVLFALMMTVFGASANEPVPTLEQRVAGLEAYLGNGDPSAALKDDQGNIPDGLTTASVGVAGPAHNAWMMVATALVLFMTLPGLALLRRPGAQQERPLGVGPVSRYRRPGHHPLVGGRL